MTTQDSSFKLATTCQNPVMALYQNKIKQHHKFLKLIREMLPIHLAEHLMYCVISRKQCLLYTNDEKWAIELRLYSPLILHTLQASRITTLQIVEIRLLEVSTPPKISHAQIPSKKTIELLRENIHEDELKQALQRLSQTLDRLS